jgi:hypothetical protein
MCLIRIVEKLIPIISTDKRKIISPYDPNDVPFKTGPKIRKNPIIEYLKKRININKLLCRGIKSQSF